MTRVINTSIVLALVMLVLTDPYFIGKTAARIEAGYHQHRDYLYGKPQVQP